MLVEYSKRGLPQQGQMAEDEGFKPPIPERGYTGFRVQRIRSLCQSSILDNAKVVFFRGTTKYLAFFLTLLIIEGRLPCKNKSGFMLHSCTLQGVVLVMIISVKICLLRWQPWHQNLLLLCPVGKQGQLRRLLQTHLVHWCSPCLGRP